MTTEKYYVVRHPEFQRRIEKKLKEYDETDYEEIIGVTPYKRDSFAQEVEYSTRKPPEAEETIKYDHSIVENIFSERVPDVVLDILEIAVATFAADKAVDRDIEIDEEDFDESRLDTRNIKLQVPVLSSQMATEEVEELYSEMVSHITRDIIEYDFQLVEKDESVDPYTGESNSEVVSLLSDGLDSTAGVFYNQNQGINSEYVTVNYGSGAGSKAQRIAEKAGIEQQTYRTQYQGNGESTQFSRGLLHLSFGVAAAVAQGVNEVRCFENGIMARFLILSEGWMTTRTVSPLFLSYFNKIMENMFPQPVEVKNPFVNLTKAEILNEIPNTDIVEETVSCPHKAWFGNSNCGLCIPCLVRNIGIIASKHSIPLDELSQYNPLLSANFENQTYDVEIAENLNDSANSPEIFFKGTAEIAYFCRLVIENNPAELARDYPDLLDETTYLQHRQFAENFVNALKTVAKQNSTVRHLLPSDSKLN